MGKTYICQKCGHKADAKTFGLFVRCPECKSGSIADLEVLERFGRSRATEKGETREEDDGSPD